MKSLVLIGSLLAVVAVSTGLLLFRDDAQVLVPPDFDLYSVQPERGGESFGILLEVMREERPYQKYPSELFRHHANRAGYKDLLRENADLIRQNYMIAKAVLSELEPLGDFAGIGDGTQGYEDEIMRFSSIRDLLQAVRFYTELSYAENCKERNLDSLMQVRAIMSKWLPHTRTLTHCMIGLVTFNQIRETLLSIAPYLDADEVAQVVAIYADIPDYSRAVENALYSEYCIAAGALDEVIAEGKGGLGYLLFKRNKTLNIYSTYMEEQIAFAREQDWDSMTARTELLEDGFDRKNLTNRGGWFFLGMAIPFADQVFQQAYEAESAELKLVEKLQKKGKGDA